MNERLDKKQRRKARELRRVRQNKRSFGFDDQLKEKRKNDGRSTRKKD